MVAPERAKASGAALPVPVRQQADPGQMFQFLGQGQGLGQIRPMDHKAVPFQPYGRAGAGGRGHRLGQLPGARRQGRGKGQPGPADLRLGQGKIQPFFRRPAQIQGQQARRMGVEDGRAIRTLPVDRAVQGGFGRRGRPGQKTSVSQGHQGEIFRFEPALGRSGTGNQTGFLRLAKNGIPGRNAAGGIAAETGQKAETSGDAADLHDLPDSRGKEAAARNRASFP